MNKQNTFASTSFILTPEEEQLLAIWRACGLEPTLKVCQGLDPIFLYLKHSDNGSLASGMRTDRGDPYFKPFKRILMQSASKAVSTADKWSFFWLFRNLPYETSLRLLKAVLRGDYPLEEYYPCTFNAQHPTFAKHQAIWAKRCTLLAIGGLPPQPSFNFMKATEWLTSYESLECRFDGAPILGKMRKSIQRLANRGHHETVRPYGKQFEQLNPRNEIPRFYVELKGLERVALIRQYIHDGQKAQ